MKIYENFKENMKGTFSSKKESFDAEKMSDPKFVEFMGRVYKDTKDLDPEINSKELVKRYEVFGNEKKVVAGLDKIYAKHLTGLAEVDSTIRQESIREFVATQLESDPDYINRLAKKVEKFEESETTLNAQKSNLKRFEKQGGSKGIEEKLEVLKRAQSSKKWWKKPFTEKPDLAVEKMKKEYRIDLQEVDEQIEEVRDILGGAKGAEKLMEKLNKQFKVIREEILSGLTIAESLAEHGREALKNKSEDLTNNRKDKNFDELKDHFAEMKSFKGEKNEINMVLADAETNQSFTEMMSEYEQELQERLVSEVANTISKTNLGELEKNLGTYLKTSEMGNMSQKESRIKVREEIEKASANTSVSDDKRFLLKVLLRKYQHLV